MTHNKSARLLALLATALAPTAGIAPPLAHATQTATLNVKLIPEQLGEGTTILFDFNINTPDGQPPAPLTDMALLYPANIGLVTSGLGLATCQPATLERLGPEGCPPDSLMGYGTALAEIDFSSEPIQETGRITTWMGPLENGHIQLLFNAEGQTPVNAQFIFTAVLSEAPAPYGGALDTTIPIIPSAPEAPDVAVTQMRDTLGPKDITYIQTYHHKRIAYHPVGLRLPETCPHGGFPFAATFTFLDGSHTQTTTTVPCPRTRRREPSQRRLRDTPVPSAAVTPDTSFASARLKSEVAGSNR